MYGAMHLLTLLLQSHFLISSGRSLIRECTLFTLDSYLLSSTTGDSSNDFEQSSNLGYRTTFGPGLLTIGLSIA